jgi:tetratricopeptide (TPR) repeat protein
MRPRLGLIIVIVGSIGTLWGVDVFLARTEHSEMLGEASRDFTGGSALLAEGRASDAIAPLRKAYALDRSNGRYALQLAAALVATGKLDEGGTLLRDLLEHNPNDGEANLAEARLLAREGDWDNAFSYYHRAIFGSWDSNGLSQKVAARLELATLLAERGLQKDLLAEILPLETEAANNPDVLRRVAQLYQIAGSAPRAEIVYRGLLRENTDDPDLYRGLGDAELALGNYRVAEAAFQNAIRNGADRSRLEQKIQLAANVAELDPTLRRLTSTEKFSRSTRILQLALDALDLCGRGDAAGQISEAQKLLAARVRGNPANELAEERLSMAERLWQTRIKACGPSTSDEEESLRLVMAKIAQ